VLTRNHINYLRGIMRKEIRWREGLVDNFQPLLGQSREDADLKLEQLQTSLAHARKVLGELDQISERAERLAQKQEELERVR
jgi:hypothetical protein